MARLPTFTIMFLPALLFASSSMETSFADQGISHHHSAENEEGTPSKGGESTPNDRATPMNHPLWGGRLRGKARDRRMEEFIKALEARKEEGDPYRKIYEQFIDDLGAKRMIDYFEEKDHACHGQLHDLGNLLMERTKNLETSIGLCGDGCTYACIHGALQNHLSKYRAEKAAKPDQTAAASTSAQPATEELKIEVNHLCREDSKLVKDFFRGNCAHAVGHGFAQMAESLDEGKKRCAYFDLIPMQYYCESGLYMEMEDSIEDKLYAENMSREERAGAAVDFCAKNAERTSACLRFLLTQAKTAKEIDALAQKCESLQGKARRGCFNAVGFSGRSYIVSQPREINNICRRGDPIDQKLCISGLSFLKKGHYQKKELRSACQYLNDKESRKLCVTQHSRFYYQIDNPIIDLMLVDR